MDFTAEQKSAVEAQIVDIITQSLEKGTIKEDQLSDISTFVLEKIDSVTNQEELAVFLHELAGKWAIFEGIHDIKQGEIQKQQDEKTVANVEQLIESGNLDQALAAAKAATNS